MTGKIFEFPAGKQRHLSATWPGVVSVTVSIAGYRQEPVAGRTDLIQLHMRFWVGIYSVGAKQETLGLEAEGVPALHAVLDLIGDAAEKRGQGLSITDYTDGAAKLPEEYRPENQTIY